MVNNVKKNKLITGSNFRDFDWNKAKLFYHLAKCGGFTKAARVAGIDQSVLTRQIQTLEIQVGRPLVIRTSGGIALTRKGEELLKLVGPFFLEVKGFCGNACVEIEGEKKRTIRIVTTHALADYVFSELAIAYNKENPNIIFEIIGEDQSIDVILSDADITIRPYDNKAVGIQQEYLFSLEKKLYASYEYLEEYGEPRTVEDLKHHRFLSYPNSIEFPYSDVAWALKVGMPEGKLRQPFFISNSVECLVAAVKNNMGIMSGYEQMSIFRDPKLKNILPEVKDKEIQVYFCYPDHLEDDSDIMGIKNYWKEKINCMVVGT